MCPLLSLFIFLIVLLIIYIIDKIVISPYFQAQIFKLQNTNVHVKFFPVLGFLKEAFSLIRVGKSPFANLQQLKLKDGKIKASFLIGMKNKPVIFLLDNDYIKDYFNKHYNYDKNKNTMFIEHELQNKNLSLLSSAGDQWKHQRQILSQFFKFHNIQKKGSQFHQIVRTSINDFKDGQSINICKLGCSIAGKSVIETFFGSEFLQKWQGYPLEQEWREILIFMFQRPQFSLAYKLRVSLFGKDFWQQSYLLSGKEKKMKKRFEKVKQYCLDYINAQVDQMKSNESLDQEDNLNFVDLMIQQYLDDKFLFEQIMGNFLSFFFAGMDTTGNFVGMCLYYAAKYPEIQEKLFQEINKQLEQVENIEEINVNQLPYMHNFIKECFRFYTPAPVTLTRTAIKEHQIGDINIKQGWSVVPVLSIDTINPKIITNCDTFDPNRWDTEEMKQLPTYSYIPFAAGPRNCIGQQMALLEVKIVLVNMLQAYKLTLVKDKKVDLTLKIVLTVKDDELVIVNKREK